MRKVNPLLKLAAISGVETAVKLHIRRGDDLDARDGSGATPMMLAAAKRRLGVVRLLLDAGATLALVDERGMNALAHAQKGGCPETIALLTEAQARMYAPGSKAAQALPDNHELLSGEEDVVSAEEPTQLPEFWMEHLSSNPSSNFSIDELEGVTAEAVAPCPVVVAHALASSGLFEDEVEIVSLDDDPLYEIFSDDWEAEDESIAPEGDETVATTARQIHETIGRHKVVDHDEGWGDVDLHLPVRAAPLARDEGTGIVSDLLLAALREGMVSEDDLIDVCSNADGTRNEEAERLLAIVVGELGATVVEWTGAEEPFHVEPSMEEERLLAEAADFAEELASGHNDPFRYYSKDLRVDLLDAEDERSLGREMEVAVHAALSALARWPEGLFVLFDAADQVARGEAEAESFCAGPEPSSGEEPTSRKNSANIEDDVSELDEYASFFVNAVATVKAAKGDAWRVAEALKETRLTRGFLMELAESTERDGAGRDFVEALERQLIARERMILSNLRLALSVAKKYRWSGLPLDDLVQEANIGLMMAVERFDWRRGFRFSTYATWWIRQSVTRAIANTGRVVRAPVHIQEAARKILQEREEMGLQLGRTEREAETARRIGASLAKTHMFLSMFDEAVPLDETDPETGLSGADVLPAMQVIDPADVVEYASLRSTLLGMLDALDERTKTVMILRFGLGGEEPITLEEVGQQFGVTRERIRQIESKAMRKLSHRNQREILWPFMGEGYAPSRLSSPEAAAKSVKVPSDPADEEPSPEDVPSLSSVPPSEFAAQASLAPWPNQEVRAIQTPAPVRETEKVLSRPSAESESHPSVFPGNQASRIADEARALGLEVDDRRSEGGVLRIVVPFSSPLNVRAFGRRLLASGFRMIQRDVFTK